MTQKISGQLEIDHERGVIYFCEDTGRTVLRVCRLDTPIPRWDKHGTTSLLDITYMHGVSWSVSVSLRSVSEASLTQDIFGDDELERYAEEHQQRADELKIEIEQESTKERPLKK